MNIGPFEIGLKTLVIAEIGNNHLGNPELASQMIDAAVECGVDAVKFQLYNSDLLVTADMPVLKHVPQNEANTQRERFRKMVLPYEAFEKLAEHAKDKDVIFLTTPFDEESTDFLDHLVPAYKIASGEANNLRLIDHIASKGKPILISTGMCTQDDVDNLVERLPRERVVLLHCIGSYPTPEDQASLSVIPFYRERYGVHVGYSDHTVGTLAPLVAVSLGAVVIEKHFILDRASPAGDRALSITPEEMRLLVQNIRRVEQMKGLASKEIQQCEEYAIKALRRGIYVIKDFKENETITESDIIATRPVVDGGRRINELENGVRFHVKGPIVAGGPITFENTKRIDPE